MIVYWLMFAVPALLAMLEQPRYRPVLSPVWLFAAFVLAMLIGFRWDTGGDWMNYYRMVEDASSAADPSGALSDPGFALLVTIAAGTSTGMLLVTVISGVLMAAALTRFCLKQPRPWLAMSVAIPYLVVVMGMGYIRQGMAVSCLMIGLSSLERGSILRYSIWVLIGALFHATALALLPLGALVANRNLLLRIGLVLVALALLFYGIHSARAEDLVNNYVQAQMSSAGAAVRLAMTAIPAALFLIYRKRFALNATEQGVWTLMSGAGILLLLAFFASPSSTVVDRMGLYLLPIQSFVYARIPSILSADPKNERIFVIAILALYTASFFVWLNFANNIDMWLPYRFYFLEDKICLEC